MDISRDIFKTLHIKFHSTCR